MTNANFNLTEKDKEMLLASGIPVELQAAYGIRRVTDEEGALIVGQQRKAGRDFSGIAFSIYSSPNQTEPAEYELRRDKPDVVIENGVEKQTGKYLRPPGRGSLLALPRNIPSELLNNISIPLLVCEGVKKMLAAWHLATWNIAPGETPRFIPVSIPGVWNWRGKVGKAIDADGAKRELKGLLSGFHNLNLKHRVLSVVFDNDVHTNFKVKLARHNLAESLQSETGAVVYFVDLPKPKDDNDKIGLDDFLGSLGGKLEKGLELLETKYRFSSELQSRILDGKLTLSIIGADRGKTKITVKNADSENIAMDSFNLSEAAKRNQFVKQIEAVETLTDAERVELRRELLGLASIADSLSEPTKIEIKSNETIQTSFQVLKDGRIVEQIRSGLAVYNPETNEHCILDSVSDSDGITYTADPDELMTKEGGVYVADELTDYESETALDSDIENYLRTYADITDLHRKMTAKYIRFTYLFDKTYELPYITATGEGGNGKTRLGELVCLASRRGLVLTNTSPASLFRIIDKYQPSLFLDELNLSDTGDDTMAILQVLNSGIKKITGYVPRQEKAADGNFQTKLFKTFCPKIIGSLKKTNSLPFNSRCVQIEMEATKRNDIPFRTTSQMLEDARILRNKLTLYRLRNFSKDFESRLDVAEKAMKAANLKPRTIQVNTPLMALTDDAKLKADFLKLLQNAESVRAQDKLETLDGEIVQAIHELIFHTGDDDKETIIYFEHGKLCQDLRVESILEIINGDRKEKDKIDGKRLGKMLKELKLSTKKIKIQGKYRDKTALVFDCEQFQKLFISFALSPFPENSCPQCPQDNKSNVDNDLRGAKGNLEENLIAPNKSNEYSTYSNGAFGAKEIQESGEGAIKTTIAPPIVTINNDGQREIFEV